jgi:hypothetical protein
MLDDGPVVHGWVRRPPDPRQLSSAAARQHVADARDAVIDQLTQTELKTLATITGKVRRRLATLGPVP